jgi:fatty-acid desaturase
MNVSVYDDPKVQVKTFQCITRNIQVQTVKIGISQIQELFLIQLIPVLIQIHFFFFVNSVSNKEVYKTSEWMFRSRANRL